MYLLHISGCSYREILFTVYRAEESRSGSLDEEASAVWVKDYVVGMIVLLCVRVIVCA